MDAVVERRSIKRAYGLKKEPKQARALEKIERILNICGRLVVELGLDAVTTNKIADAAGINIASLYQYFPNKDSIISALVTRGALSFVDQLESVTKAQHSVSMREAMTAILSCGVSTYRNNELLLNELLTSYQSFQTIPGFEAIEKPLYSSAVQYLKRQDGVHVENIDNALYLLNHSILYALFKHLREKDSAMSDDVIINELVDMSCRYLIDGLQ